MNSNITKMNIVYKREFEAEAEYLKEFFSLIGFVVTEICPTSNHDLSKEYILKQIYAENTITIMLNHFGSALANTSYAIIYMYFYAKDGITFTDDIPCTPNELKILKIKSQAMNRIGIINPKEMLDIKHWIL